MWSITALVNIGQLNGDIMAVLGTRIRKCLTFCAIPKTFSNSCAQNHHDLLAKIVGEVDGTKCGELCCYKHWALVELLDCAISNFKILNGDLWLCWRFIYSRMHNRWNEIFFKITKNWGRWKMTFFWVDQFEFFWEKKYFLFFRYLFFCILDGFFRI